MENTVSQRMKEILFLVASQPYVQTSSFPLFVNIPDEIIMEVGDAIELAQQYEIGVDDLKILEALKAIDFLFSSEGLQADVWTMEGMDSSHTWQKARSIAKETINNMRLTNKKPDLFWLTYYPKK